MIDNVKLFVNDKHRFENHIINNGLMELSSTVNHYTGEVNEYPKRGNDLNLNVNITQNQATILGSIHKYNNIKEDRGNQNYNDFSFCQIVEVIRELEEKYQIKNEKDTSITNLEFGFNLVVEKDPKLIIDSNLLMNNYKSPNKNLKFLGRGDYKEFQLTDYNIKFYNKSKQFKLGTHVLRIELKITRKRFLQKLDIYSLEDLMYNWTYVKLFEDFIDKFEGLMIVDEFDADLIPEKDYNKLIKYTNPNYWISIKGKSPKVIYRLKKDFNILLNKYDLLKTKNELREKLESKFIELLNSDCSDSEYREVG
ncbi:hypothetical protein [Flavobacterium xueshanense]|uniref:Replication initiation factor n=1 Tax=Flavobacterium xueshanense TaxID=935223 RepID=A0A1I2AG42_9FLAO|nr:hypothetical protein [Flavobacterium xueshanense]SFE42975.1 hypothetical protein SAMN04488131_1024 [Flavobacterium xueshanense]